MIFICILLIFISIVLAYLLLNLQSKYKVLIDDNRSRQLQIEKQYDFYHLLIAWIAIYQQNRFLSEYFKEKNYKKIAIYGMKEIGIRLLEELKGTEIEVVYAIDKDAAHIYLDVEVYEPDDSLPETDVIVVTAISYYTEIRENMKKRVSCPIINLEDIIFEFNP